jgi:hypothetical protein
LDEVKITIAKTIKGSFGSRIVGAQEGALAREMPDLLAEIAGPRRGTEWHSSFHEIDIGTRVCHHRRPAIVRPVGESD